MEIRLFGIGVSPGIAIGPVLAFGVHSLEIPKYAATDRGAERARLATAMSAVREDLERLRLQTEQELGAQHADIFKAHVMLLDDVTLADELEAGIQQEPYNCEYIVNELIAKYSKVMEEVDDPRFRERTQDLVDVGTRILGKLLNAKLASLERLDEPCVIVSHDLSPSDTANIDTVNTLGIAIDVGGPTSHTAILARALEIPAVVGLRHVGAHALPGDTLIVDGSQGLVIIRPNEGTLREYREEKRRVENARVALLAEEGEGPSRTLDGNEVPVLANIELPVEISHSLKAKAQGIGLYRTEYLFLSRNTLPSEQQQFEAYAEVASSFAPRPVTLRTLDLGGDKFVSQLRYAEELNPQLGWRAIRFCLARPDIFKAQLRAMLRASVHGHVKIMLPLISGLEEFRRVKEIVREVSADLERRGVPFDKEVELGSMIEVPSAVAIADILARECDFFSVGTNDLIQYSLAVDRVNERIAHMYEPAHPAVLRMIRATARAARDARIPCGICGEMAGDPLFTELLIGLGVDSLSMSAIAIPEVRAEIGAMRMRVARKLARRVVEFGTAAEIRALLLKRREGRAGTDPATARAARAQRTEG